MNLWCTLFLVMLIVLAEGTENNAISYWNEQGNDLFNQGNITEAIKCYNKAIDLGNQTNAPIFNEIVIQCGYHMDVIDKNNHSQVLSKICAGPINSIEGQPNPESKDLAISFDVSNPNSMHMRISNMYINVIKYDSINSSKIIEDFGVKKARGYLCNIKPKIGSYECIQTLSNDEFIDLAPGELEHFVIKVNTNTPGVYKLRISLDYVIGSEANSINVGDVPGMIGFFDNKIAQSHNEAAL